MHSRQLEEQHEEEAVEQQHHEPHAAPENPCGPKSGSKHFFLNLIRSFVASTQIATCSTTASKDKMVARPVRSARDSSPTSSTIWPTKNGSRLASPPVTQPCALSALVYQEGNADPVRVEATDECQVVDCRAKCAHTAHIVRAHDNIIASLNRTDIVRT